MRLPLRALGCVLCTFSLALVGLRSAAAEPEMRAQIVPSHIDFGAFERRPSVGPTTTIAIQNTLGQVLNVDQIVAGCGCITADSFRPLGIEPGQSAEFHLRIDPAQMSVGEHEYEIEALSIGRTVATARAKYRFEPPIVAFPLSPIWKREGDRRWSSSVTVRHRRGLVWSPRVVPDDARVTVAVRADDRHPDTSELLIECKDTDAPPTGVAVELVVGDVPFVQLSPVGAGGQFEAVPRVVELGEVEEGASFVRSITIVGPRFGTVGVVSTSSQRLRILTMKPVHGANLIQFEITPQFDEHGESKETLVAEVNFDGTKSKIEVLVVAKRSR